MPAVHQTINLSLLKTTNNLDGISTERDFCKYSKTWATINSVFSWLAVNINVKSKYFKKHDKSTSEHKAAW